MIERARNPFRTTGIGKRTGLFLAALLLTSGGCAAFNLNHASTPPQESGPEQQGVQMTIYSSPSELAGVDFTIFNPDAEVRIEEQRTGWHLVSMEVYVLESDARALLLHGLGIEVISGEEELRHVRLRGWIPEEALSLPSAPVREQDVRLEVIEWAWRVVSGGVFIHGVVRNSGEVTAHEARITVSATDELGQQLVPGTVRLKPDSVEPGTTAHFEVRLDAISEPRRIFAYFKLSARP